VPFQETTNNYWTVASEISKFGCIQLRLVRDTENNVMQKNNILCQTWNIVFEKERPIL